MPVSGRKPTGKPTRDRNPRVHDWTEVPNVPFAGAPALPKSRTRGRRWPAPTKAWWAAISTMPHCVLWSSGDWQYAMDTAMVAAEFHSGDVRLATELRNREKVLGTTLDYRSDLRIRYVEAKVDSSADVGEVAHLDDYRDLYE